MTEQSSWNPSGASHQFQELALASLSIDMNPRPDIPFTSECATIAMSCYCDMRTAKILDIFPLSGIAEPDFPISTSSPDTLIF